MSKENNPRARTFVCTVHIKNMINSGLTEEQYKDPETVATHFIKKWEQSGNNRKAAAVVCLSASGTYHIHMAVIGNTTTLSYIGKTLWNSYTEPMYGNKEQLKSYLLKEGNFQEKGEQILYAKGLEILQSHQGKRSDLEEIEHLLDEGYTPNMIFSESLGYRRYEKMVKSEYIARRINSVENGIKETHHEWHFGLSGSGKSHTTYLQHKIDGHNPYLCTDPSPTGGGFDFYADEGMSDYIVIDDLRPYDLNYKNLLNLLDVYPNQIHCRYANCYNVASHILITTVYDPFAFYRLQVEDTTQTVDSFKQLLRRLETIHYHYINNKGEYKEYVIPAAQFTSGADMIAQSKIYETHKKELEAVEESHNINKDLFESFGMKLTENN